ncbi:hypothetical protein CNBI3270 [Cryptococcus deneoformans B-3501A]|uniref:CFEM domain-containing protein n=1 Tax=Cryptococcus deneoformans (strain JEC21 / ATCC MYA-565) TaxID=214684 RepID=Q5KD70_CRYD1|nr:hypothetical protein CNH03500 [Cryptococcus neoformans var. neoformans JEC21]XP_773388.1 hypothetical protein CNBI3270 [Cryptococcus neoformans var. neoformans B-3501A]AAW45208.1 hypothetical protein CNH03500 [Cryptococcus neoformans var. neoformans JEC21]EAL18741.1 hypothetical protein CNBI3270 [Cryptococcus neoformans var. neoformans B-3501A]
MKFFVAAVALVPAVMVNAYTTCMLTCMSEQQPTYCPSASSYNETSCLCSDDFITYVKNCLYQSDCSTDVPVWYDLSEDACNTTSSSSSAAAASTASSQSSSSDAAASTSSASTAETSSASSGAASVFGNAAAFGSVAIGVSAVIGGALLL